MPPDGSPEGRRAMPRDDRSTSMDLIFFNEEEAQTVEAVAARIIPGDATDPGAREAGVVTYIDRSLAGFLRDLQTFYRRALQELDDYSRDRHNSPFRELTEGDQDRVLAELDSVSIVETESREYGTDALQDENKEGDESVSTLLIRFFSIIREHVLQGMFCDPAYGGNRDTVGWKMVGFPGAQWGYSAEQMKPGFDASQIPVLTLQDLHQRYSRTDRNNGTEGSR
jgi:gluconate 2-dehydrogenase gamma chain